MGAIPGAGRYVELPALSVMRTRPNGAIVASPRWAQCVVAILVAAVEAALRLMEFVHAPYYALFVVGPTAILIEIALARRAAGLATAPASTAGGTPLAHSMPQETTNVRT